MRNISGSPLSSNVDVFIHRPLIYNGSQHDLQLGSQLLSDLVAKSVAEVHHSLNPEINSYRTILQEAIQKFGLFESEPMRRTAEISESFTPPCPKDLASLIGEYDQQDFLQQIDLNEFGEPALTESNKKLSRVLLEIFSRCDPSSRLLQKNIVRQHGSVALTPLFLEPAAKYITKSYGESRFGHQGFSTRDLVKFSTVAINFLSKSNWIKWIEERIAHFYVCIQARSDNIFPNIFAPADLAATCLPFALELLKIANGLHIDSSDLRQIDNQIKVAQSRAWLSQSAFVATCNWHAQALDCARSALEIACSTGDKQFIVRTVHDLIVSIGRTIPIPTDELVVLFGTVRRLCLSYPQDNISYAKLLFTVTDVVAARSKQLSVLPLYAQAKPVLNHGLPLAYRGKFIYRHLALQFQTPLNFAAQLSLLVEAFPSFLMIAGPSMFQSPPTMHQSIVDLTGPVSPKERLTRITVPRNRKFDDVSRSEFFLYMSCIFFITAETLAKRERIDNELTQTEQSEFMKLYESFVHFISDSNLRLAEFRIMEVKNHKYQKNKQQGSRQDVSLTPEELIGQTAARCYRISLMILMRITPRFQTLSANTFFNQLGLKHTDARIKGGYLTTSQIWQPFFSIFDSMVRFHLDGGYLDELDYVLAKKTTDEFSEVAHFKTALREWRKLLKTAQRLSISAQSAEKEISRPSRPRSKKRAKRDTLE